MARKPKTLTCDLAVTLRVLGGRWKVLVLRHLLDGSQRFNQLHRNLSGISHRTLARQLRELAQDGIVSRKAFMEIPPRVEYSLTRLGETLGPVLQSMHDWGRQFSHRVPERER